MVKPLNLSKSKYNIQKEFDIRQKLGVGSYSNVFLASRKEDNQLVAIKHSKGSTKINRLYEEFKLLNSLDHSCIPKAIDYKIDELRNQAYLIMEYVDGIPSDELTNLGSTQEEVEK